MNTALIPSNRAFNSYPQCGTSMLTDNFGYELTNYGGRTVNSYPQGNENFNLTVWEPQYQPTIEFGGLFASNGAHHQRYAKTAINGTKASKPRRRVATMAQRRAANIRERRRMFNLNEAFDILRKKVPTFAYEKRLSRIETLRLAMTYIAFMTQVVRGSDQVQQQWSAPAHGIIANVTQCRHVGSPH